MQKHLIVLTDDLDGNAADETVVFSLDGVFFEIDLSAGNAEEMRATFARYSTAGRLTKRTAASVKVDRPAAIQELLPLAVEIEPNGRPKGARKQPALQLASRTRPASKPPASGSTNGSAGASSKAEVTDERRTQRDVIRAWAATQGIAVADFGRIPRNVTDAFEQAQKGTAVGQQIPRKANGTSAAAGPVSVRSVKIPPRSGGRQMTRADENGNGRAAAAASFSG